MKKDMTIEALNELKTQGWLDNRTAQFLKKQIKLGEELKRIELFNQAEIKKLKGDIFLLEKIEASNF